MTTQKNVGWVRPEAVTHQDQATGQNDWPILAIEQVADVNPRIDKLAIPDNLPVSFVPMPAVGAGNGSIHVEETRPAGEVKKGFTAFLEGDVLFAKITPCMENGKMAVVPKLVNGYGFGSTEFHVLRPKAGIEAKYLYYYVSSQSFRGEAERYMTGAVGQKRVSTTYLKEAKIPVAPLDQQKHIVAEIEKQFSRLDEAVANLKRVKANLKRYKAAVLKAAVEGRLVETEAELARKEGRSLPTPRPGVFYVYAIRCSDDSIYIGHTDNLARRWEEHLAGQAADWTMQHKPMQIVHYEEYSSRQEAADREKWLKTGYGRKRIKREIEAGRARQVGYETGAQLLQRILETRRSQWLASAEQAGRKGKGKYKEPAAPDTADLPELPDGWVWALIGQAFDVYVGATPSRGKPEYWDGGISWVSSGEVAFCRIKRTRETISSEGLASSSVRVHPVGTVLLGMIGEGKTRGQAAILDIEASNNQNAAAIRVSETEILPEYVFSFLEKEYEDTRRRGSGGNQPALNKDRVREIPFPLPPIAEQHRIVTEIDCRLSLIREIVSQVDASLIRAERLRQSILMRAFGGRLMSENHGQWLEQVAGTDLSMGAC